ncbi:MAG: class I SAM-dependent methyltransferase [Pseudomonadota bacterium]
MAQANVGARFWDGVARKYARDPIADMAGYQYTLDRTKSYLSEKDVVLELGAGTSSTALDLAPGVTRYLATDISPEMVRIGREKAGDTAPLEIEVGTSATMAARGETFDAVLAHNLVHLLPDLPNALADIAKLTRTGGVFIQKTACLASAPWFKRVFYRVMIAALSLMGKAPGVVHFLRGEELDVMVRAAGFEIVETSQDKGDVPRRYIVARKL